jgi:hypothetical protein
MRGYEVHTIAGLPNEAFEALAKSGALSKADVAAARAMRAGRTAKRHEEVTIRKREEVQVETPIQKIERAQAHAAALNDAITAYAKAHSCSRERAMEAVLAHPSTSEYVRLDKALAAAEREAAALQKLEGTAGTNHPINRSKPARTPTPVRPSESGRVAPHDAPAATNDEMTAEEALERLADLQQTRNPAMSRGHAVSLAALSPEFSAAHRAEKLRKGL